MMAGALDRRIVFQTFYETQDASGHPVKTWSDLEQTPRVWAELVPVTGREQFASQQVVAEADVHFRIRWRGDLSVEMRIVYRDETYDVLAISEIGRREGLEILARKVVE